MKRYIIPTIILIAAGCQAPMADEAKLKEVNERNLEVLTAAIDSLGSNTTIWDDLKFSVKEAEVDKSRAALAEMQEDSKAYKKAEKAHELLLKEYEEERIKFLESRKEELKEIYALTGATMSALDENLADLQKTKKDPFVTSYTVAASRFKDYFTIQGNLEAKNNALVYPEMLGNVKVLHVEKGDRVHRDQLLATLDTEIIQRQIEELNTSLLLAVDLHERQQRLWDQEIGSEVQLLEAKNRKESLQGTLATLQEQKAMGMIRAPFSGIIDELNVKAGGMANPMIPVARIVNRDELYIEADVSERHFGKITLGREVLVSVQGMEGTNDLKAHVSRVGSYIKPDNRTFQIRVDFDSARTDMIPNLVADLKINEWDSEDDLPVLPASMVLEDANQMNYVWKLVSSEKDDRMKVEKVMIEAGRTYKGETCILSGLNDGDVIIDKGVRKVKDGNNVRVESPASGVAVK